jgi:hypothetical protein
MLREAIEGAYRLHRLGVPSEDIYCWWMAQWHELCITRGHRYAHCPTCETAIGQRIILAVIEVLPSLEYKAWAKARPSDHIRMPLSRRT